MSDVAKNVRELKPPHTHHSFMHVSAIRCALSLSWAAGFNCTFVGFISSVLVHRRSTITSEIKYYFGKKRFIFNNSRSPLRTDLKAMILLVILRAILQTSSQRVSVNPLSRSPIPVLRGWLLSRETMRSWQRKQEAKAKGEAVMRPMGGAHANGSSSTAPSGPSSGASTQSWWRWQVGKRGLLVWFREAHMQALTAVVLPTQPMLSLPSSSSTTQPARGGFRIHKIIPDKTLAKPFWTQK
jgi:hypothetical protein